MPVEFTLIANPTSGRGKAHAVAREVFEGLQRAGRSAELVLTSAPGDARRITEQAAAAWTSVVVGSGGDGTLQEIASVLQGTFIALGILPTGRCNDLAHALGIQKKDGAERFTQILLGNRTRKIDLGVFESQAPQAVRRFFCTVATLGFDTEVTQFVAQHRLPFKGTLAYLYAVLHKLIRFKPLKVRLSGDFGVFEGSVFLVATGNAPFYGGAMEIAPGAQMDDGLFHVCLVEAVPRRTILRILPKVFNGAHLSHPKVHLLKTSKMSIETDGSAHVLCGDGEVLGSTPCVLKVVPASLLVKC